MLVLEAFSGASGDMFMAALIDAGADSDLLSQVEDVVPVDIEIERVTREGIDAVKVNVKGGGDDGGDNHVHREYTEVIDIVESSDLPGDVTKDAAEVFRLIGEAEAEVHGEPLSDLEFHEVGADDAIADVLGASLLIHDLDEEAYTTPINVGGGSVESAHGTMPVPVPAVTEILGGTGHVMKGGPVEQELLTPTGAALIAHYTSPVRFIPEMNVEITGYGAGAKEIDGHPNVLRAIRGKGAMSNDGVCVLETNVDDVSGEVLGEVFDVLMDAGARDVTVSPIYMKKNRPGHHIRVICRSGDEERLARLLARETGSLGVRSSVHMHRFIADREVRDVEFELDGEVFGATVKVGYMDEDVYDVSAEFRDARRIAEKTGRSAREVMSLIEESFRESELDS